MCEYEKNCIEKPVSPIMRRNCFYNFEEPCEKNIFSCIEYQMKRRCARSEVSGSSGQVHLSELVAS